MTAAVTWGPISAVYTPAGGSAYPITDLMDMEFDDSINLQELLTDNNTDINLIFGTGGKCGFTLKSTDTSLAWGSTVPTGTVGSLVITFGKRAAGKGYVSGANKVMTAGNAVIGQRRGTASSSSAGSSDWNFTAYNTGSGIFAVV